jgi:hypothetical protein
MAVDANSYGTAAGVAALVPTLGNINGTFDASTQPTTLVVEAWIDQLSGAVNMELTAYGYSVPATGTMASWLTGWVNGEVAAQAKAIYQRTMRGPTDDENRDSGPRDLLTNIKRIREMLDSQSRGDKYVAGSKAVTRKDGYSDEYDTTEAP